MHLGPGFDRTILQHTAHRPWAMPRGPWLMTQTWHDLLFAHWRVDAARIRPRVPAALELDLFENEAWIGIVPFRMANVSARGVPALPWLSEFPELNVRTYVRVGGRPGIYFFSLDAARVLAVHTARTLLNLPYHVASMAVGGAGDAIEYESRRQSSPPGPRADFHATYRPIDLPFVAAPGSLEYFLAERYCLYHVNRRGKPYRLDIHHPPWRLQRATAVLHQNTMGEVNGFCLSDAAAPLLHFVKRQDTVAWLPSAL